MKVLVTGAAGFIGMHTVARLLARGDEVVGIDDLNGYYSVELKRARLQSLQAQRGFHFTQMDISDHASLQRLCATERPQRVLHLAAQAGVRHSVTHPETYLRSNLVGFGNVLEACRHHDVEHLVYASSSSIYGGNTRLPFQEDQNVDHPVSLYAATKKANELMAHCYSHLYRLPTTGLRFFTVYGPWGRPDMSPMLFASAILAGKAIDVFNEGKMARDFTYIDDIVEGVVRVLDKSAAPDPAFDSSDPRPSVSDAPYRVFNIGNSAPVALLEYIAALEHALGVEAKKNLLPMQPGDVVATSADSGALETWVGFKPRTPLSEGVRHFVAWYRQYYA
jgi:UDP-glucuronate 4-epimerase